MIRVEGLTFTYPDAEQPALNDVSLSIEEGHFVLVAGPSGAGKSTLLRCLNGLVPHFSGGTVRGSVTVAGHDPVEAGPQALSRFVGCVFQDPEAQFVVDVVEDEIAFALENAGMPPAEMQSRVEEVLNLLGLTSLRARPLMTLSSGEKQRVAIAAALALRPRVLALDEPTSQLDPESAEEVLQALVRLNRDIGLTVVLAEHRMERVLPHVDQVIYLAPGRPTLSGTPRNVLRWTPLAPPLVSLGRALGWQPLPLTVEAARPLAARVEVPTAPRPALRPPASPLLIVDGLSFAYESSVVLQSVRLTIHEGERIALMGRNGAGKTTLLRCIVGLLEPSEGRIELAGRSLVGAETADISREVGYLPQTPDDLLFADTVDEELATTLRNHGLLSNPPVPPYKLEEELGLAEVRFRYPRDLSVGQRQRVALGAIAVTRPRLLLLDEPTRGLDYGAKGQLVALLERWQGQGTAVILTTHDVELAAQAAERVVILEKGVIVADDAPARLAGSPLFCPQVAQLFPDSGWLTVDALAASMGCDRLRGDNGSVSSG